MKLSTKGRYGARAMVDIAMQNAQGPALMKDIATRQNISPKYLDHILSALRRAGLLKNIRGRGGGYMLTRPAAQINLKNIIEAVEGSLAPAECVDNTSICDRISQCPTRDIWKKLKETIENVLEETTLESLIDAQKAKEPHATNYII
ncbi:MAG: Rrf2 family transcriptional regulator [Pseudomonadota bacterium]